MSILNKQSQDELGPIQLKEKVDIVIEKYDSLHLTHKKPFTNVRMENGSLVIYDKYRYRVVEPNKTLKSDHGRIQINKHPKMSKLGNLKKSILIGVSNNGKWIACITNNKTLFIYDKEVDYCQELEISQNFIEIIEFPDDSKFMIRKRSAGLGLYDQIVSQNQALFVSDNGYYVIFVSMMGIIYIDVQNDDWKIVNKFQGKFTFQYDVSFASKNGSIDNIKIVLAMKMKSSRFTEKLEFQYINILLKDGSPVVKLANLLHLVKIPLEMIESQNIKNTNPLILKIIKDKCVVIMNYCDNKLELSKLFLLYKPENEVILCAPIFPDIIDKISSTSRNVYISCIQSIQMPIYEEYYDNKNKRELNNSDIDPYTRVLTTSEMFLLLLSNGEFLMYSEFDGRLIEIKSKELYSQNKMQNLKLYNENIEANKSISTKNRKRDGSYHSFVTNNNLIIISNGFDYTFYYYEFSVALPSTNQLIYESNLAYIKELEQYKEFPKLESYIDKFDKQISFKFHLKDDLFL